MDKAEFIYEIGFFFPNCLSYNEVQNDTPLLLDQYDTHKVWTGIFEKLPISSFIGKIPSPKVTYISYYNTTT